MIRVLVVDDSLVVRRMLSDALATESRISVVGSAANGAIALQKLGPLKPDVVILDVEMPDMDGIETVKRLRVDHPKLPVIMCSALTERGAEVTLRALAAGATHYVTKPSTLATERDGLGAFKAQLVTSVLALAAPGPSASVMPPVKASLPVTAPLARPSLRKDVAALAIGCSTGGPNALAKLFSRLPSDLPVPIFIVQHMPPLFTRMLADSLSASSQVRVHEAEHGAVALPGHAYIAPGNFHLSVAREGVRLLTLLDQSPPESSCRPAVDVLFRSVAKVFGRGVLACVLTGMGHDGARGAAAISAAGGSILVQSAETCVVPSMPEGVVSAGLAEAALSPEQLGDELVQRVRRSALGAGRVVPNGRSESDVYG